MKVVVPAGTLASEDNLAVYLSNPVGTQQSVLQQCNDGGEVIYVQFTGIGATGLQQVDAHGNPVIVPAQGFRFERMKSRLRDKKFLSFVSFDSFVDEEIVLASNPDIETIPLVVEMEDGKLVFYGEDMTERKGLIKQRKSKEVVVIDAVIPNLHKKVKLLFVKNDINDAQELRDELKKKMSSSDRLYISGMFIPRHIPVKGIAKQVDDVIVNDFKIREDKFEDVKEIIPKINEWKDLAIWRDLGTGMPFYDREVNELLMFNVCYVKEGRAVFNLIVSGIASTAKTSCVTEYARIFEDSGEIMQSQGSTTKGLLPSFAGDVPKPGYLASPGFMKVVDEIFRHVTSQHSNAGMAKTFGAMGEFLSKLLPILTRREQIYSSAKDNKFTAVMRAGLLACDNLNDDVKAGLAVQVNRDPAVLRRFTIIYLKESEWERIKVASIVPAEDEIHGMTREFWMKTYGYDLKLLKRFARWFRKEVHHVHANSMRCLEIAKGVVRDRLSKERYVGAADDFDKTMDSLSKKVDFTDHVRALVECCALMRAVYTEKNQVLPKNVVVIEDDYVEAKRIFSRIVDDCMVLFRPYLLDAAMEKSSSGSGIMRF